MTAAPTSVTRRPRREPVLVGEVATSPGCASARQGHHGAAAHADVVELRPAVLEHSGDARVLVPGAFTAPVGEQGVDGSSTARARRRAASAPACRRPVERPRPSARQADAGSAAGKARAGIASPSTCRTVSGLAVSSRYQRPSSPFSEWTKTSPSPTTTQMMVRCTGAPAPRLVSMSTSSTDSSRPGHLRRLCTLRSAVEPSRRVVAAAAPSTPQVAAGTGPSVPSQPSPECLTTRRDAGPRDQPESRRQAIPLAARPALAGAARAAGPRPQAQLTVDPIVAAAIEMADADGSRRALDARPGRAPRRRHDVPLHARAGQGGADRPHARHRPR